MAWLDGDTSHSDDVADGTRGDCDDRRALMQSLFVTMVNLSSRQAMELRTTSSESSMAEVGGVDSTADGGGDVSGVRAPHVDESSGVDDDTMMRCESDQQSTCR